MTTPYSPTTDHDRPYGYRAAGPLIGLIGYARSGKDTAAAALVERHGYRRFGFADALKDAAYALDPIVEVQLWGECAPELTRLADIVDCLGWEAAKDTVPEVRRILQYFGAGLRDTLGPDIWCDHVMRQVDADPSPCVIPDVRYPNEAEAIRRRGGVLVRIERPGHGPVNAHLSETGLDAEPVDFTLINASSVEQLRQNVCAIHSAITL